jgi:hypothetical protein
MKEVVEKFFWRGERPIRPDQKWRAIVIGDPLSAEYKRVAAEPDPASPRNRPESEKSL